MNLQIDLFAYLITTLSYNTNIDFLNFDLGSVFILFKNKNSLFIIIYTSNRNGMYMFQNVQRTTMETY